jgi:hypothetical protein
MKRYQFVLAVVVEVEAFSEADAREIVMDTFGPGEDCGVEVKNLAIQDIND